MKKSRWAMNAESKSIACPGYSVVDLDALFVGKQPESWKVGVIFRRKRDERLSRREEGVCFGAWDRDNSLLDRPRHPVSLKGEHWSDCAVEIRFGWPGVVHEKFMINLKDCHVDYVFWQMYGITEQLLESESVQRARGRTLKESLSMDTLILCRLKQVDINAWQPVFILEEPTNISRPHSRRSSLQVSPRNLPRFHTTRRSSDTLTIISSKDLTGSESIPSMSPASQSEGGSISRAFTPLPTGIDTSSASGLESSPATTRSNSSPSLSEVSGCSNGITMIRDQAEVGKSNLDESLSASDMCEIPGKPNSPRDNIFDMPCEYSWNSDPSHLGPLAIADRMSRDHSDHLMSHLLPAFELVPQDIGSESAFPCPTDATRRVAGSNGRGSLSTNHTSARDYIQLSQQPDGYVRLEMQLTLYERLHAQGLPREFPAPIPASGLSVVPESLQSTVLDNDFVWVDHSVGTEDSLSQWMWEALRGAGGQFM
ncbi:hypothetical protein SISNIDRAFT_488921 [Sistotremastrum niveocremeum HHB9708]|uniref:Uncharacterized protein n=1 Tax=Sistotremastrum niveocremeum HHB9708 TaxID=1314777 RepID=A0A164QKT0_9AGAM|nr:hypothetical protein SISNIDRAFT_488921 [Sistotremastrum niveocremeum HHB9708]